MEFKPIWCIFAKPNRKKMEDSRREQEEIFSKRVRAGKRTYFFDVKATKNEDYFITITESKRSRYEEGVYNKSKIYLYKEDFVKFNNALSETIGHVRTELLPEYDFEEYARRDSDNNDDSDY